MGELVFACAFFIAIHLGVSGYPAGRARLVRKWGEKPYMIGFAVASLLGLVWMGSAYSRAGYEELWGQLLFLRAVAGVLMLVAFLFVATGRISPNPTIVGQGHLLESGFQARGILRVTRHPMMWGIAMWALVHLVVNGDLASVIFFGSLLLLSLLGTVSIDFKRRLAYGEAWKRLERETSNIPFVAVIQGRNRLQLREVGWKGPLLGVLLYLLFLYLHPFLFGVPAIG